jgi:aldehyde dehydrogenase (NAD+)
MAVHYKMYIDGEWVDSSSGETFPTENPFTGEVWANIPRATAEDAERALAAARRESDGEWAKVSGVKRGLLMNKLADLIDANAAHLSMIESTDNGKVTRETEAQMHVVARQMRFFAGYADKIYGKTIPLDNPSMFDYTLREPLGVVVMITPWNSPLSLLSNKLCPALAAGNTAIVKPSRSTSASTIELAKLVEQAGFPKGVFNVVTGDVCGDVLTGSPKANKISLTGGTEVAQHILKEAANNITRVTMELGGKSPNIIFADASLDRAIIGALTGIFQAAGQTCVAGSRLLVEEPVYDKVVKEVIAGAERIKLGDPFQKDTGMGPVANRKQMDTILGLIDGAVAEGAKVLTGGKRVTEGELAKGYFIAPTVLEVTNDMMIAQTEVFGPVLCIIKFKTEEEAVQIANDTKYGLAAGIWTNNASRAHRVARKIQAGMIWINTYRSMAAQTPFGGYKLSGYGKERGEEALYEYTQLKNIMMDLSSDVYDQYTMRM